MGSIAGIFTLLGVAFLGSKLNFSRVNRGTRHLLLMGCEFLFVGVVLCPHVTGLISTETLNYLDPLLSFGLGWVGLLFGLQFEVRKLKDFTAPYYLLTLIESLITMAAVSGVMFGLISAISIIPAHQAVFLSVFFGACACITSPSALALVIRERYHAGTSCELSPDIEPLCARERLSAQVLSFVTAIDDLVGLLAIGILFSIYHPYEALVGINLMSGGYLFIFTVGLGVLLGLLFDALVRPAYQRRELDLLVIGVAVLSSGLARWLGLNPLVINVVIGITLANRSVLHEQVFNVTKSIEKPVYLGLLIIGGANWNPSGYTWMMALMLAVYILTRLVGKTSGMALCLGLLPSPQPLRKDLGLGLVSQGGMALALAISFGQAYSGTLIDMAVTLVLLAGVISEFAGPWLAMGVLRRAGGGEDAA